MMSSLRTRLWKAKAILSQRRVVLDDLNIKAAYAQDVSEFLRNKQADPAQRAFIGTYVKQIAVMYCNDVVR